MMDFTHGSFFTGIGGFDLAAEWAGWKNVFAVENEERICQPLIRARFPGSALYSDINDFIKKDAKKYAGTVDVISGGFPCQGFSIAGGRLATEDPRFLWPQMLRGIEIVGPSWVVAENVADIRSMEDKRVPISELSFRVDSRSVTRFDTHDVFKGIYSREAKMLLSQIFQDLEKIGYSVDGYLIPAAGVGAPHQRERLWIVAHSEAQDDRRRQRIEKKRQISESRNSAFEGNAANADKKRGNRRPGSDPEESSEVRRRQPENARRSNDSNTNEERRPERHLASIAGEPGFDSGHPFSRWNDWPAEPPVCGANDGVSAGLDGSARIGALGNAVVPQIPYLIFQSINKTYEQDF